MDCFGEMINEYVKLVKISLIKASLRIMNFLSHTVSNPEKETKFHLSKNSNGQNFQFPNYDN